MKNILVTGGAGFIGSNFIPFAMKRWPEAQFINLDKLTYAASLTNLKEIEDNPRYKLVHGDIGDTALVQNLFETHKIDSVFHFAAESHVDNSISGPGLFFQTNVMGTYNLINCARNAWLNKDLSHKEEFAKARFLHVSTDEVYGTLGETGFFTESTPYAPNSPYSASKASSDFVVRSFCHTYGMNVVTTNCSNNFGPKQHGEKLIPTIIRNAVAGNKIPIYGTGANIRDWLYVLDHCEGIALAFEKGLAGETYNIGGRNEKTNLQVAEAICTLLDGLKPKNGSYKDQISFVKDRAGHDFRYAIDATKAEQKLDWKAKENFSTGMLKTLEWYLR